MSELMHQQTLEHCAQRVEIGTRTTIQGIMQAGQALSEARSIFGENDKGFGQWRESRLPWLKQDTARSWLRVWEKFGDSNLLRNNSGVEISATILYQLAAPSTPDEVIEKATEKAEAGEKVSVEDVKRWKAEAEHAHRQAKELQICAMQNQEKAEQLRMSLEAAQEKIDRLTEQESQDIAGWKHDIECAKAEKRLAESALKKAYEEMDEIRKQQRVEIKEVVKEVLPPDYESTKVALELARKDADAALFRLNEMKKRHDQEIIAGVQDAIKLHKNDLEAMERKRAQAEARLEELNAHIQLLGSKAETHKFHDKVIGEWEHELIELSLMVTEFRYIPETHDKWLRLAKNFKDAGQAIELLIAEKSGRSLNDRPDTGSNNSGGAATNPGH